MDLNEKIAMTIRRKRRLLGIKATTMARSLNISVSAYSKIENAKVYITMWHLEHIAECLNIPVVQLFESDIIEGLTLN